MLRRRPVRVLVALSGVVLVTFVGYRVIPVNATTVGFAYLLLILIVASTSGFLEAALSSLLATLLFNFFFLPPVGTFTVADPQNWVALFSFLATSLIASRLSTTGQGQSIGGHRAPEGSRAPVRLQPGDVADRQERSLCETACRKTGGDL